METKTYKKNEPNMKPEKRCNYMKTEAKNVGIELKFDNRMKLFAKIQTCLSRYHCYFCFVHRYN